MHTGLFFIRNLLKIFDDNNNLQDRYVLPNNGTMFSPKVQLPKDLTCSHCVIQWTYVAGNYLLIGESLVTVHQFYRKILDYNLLMAFSLSPSS